MRIDVHVLESYKVAKVYLPKVEARFEGKDIGKGVDYYKALPTDVQCALGYMACLEDTASGRAIRPTFARFHEGMLRKVLSFHQPIYFLGWAGWHNEVGPCYLIEGACLSEGSRLFYTDDDMRGRPELARRQAERIARESSGISDVRAEQLSCLRTMERDYQEVRWCVTFKLDASMQRPVALEGDEICPEGDDAIFVLPWAGEFDCMLGEIVGGDTDNAFVLAHHAYCMK